MRRLLAGVTVAVVALAASSCGDDDQPVESEPLDVFGPYLAGEADAFAASLRGFERATGVPVRYTGSADFAHDLRERVDGGVDVPDLAIVPQPGLVRELAEDGRIVAFDADSLAAVERHFDLGVDDITLAGGATFLPYRASAKSIVWYRPDVFAEHGWTIPTTLDELGTLVGAIQATEGAPAPWCFSVFASSSTGWPATDWIEDLVLRRAGPDAYDRWVAGDLGFGSAPVQAAFDELADLVLAPGRTAGGLRAVLQTEVQLAGAPLFDDPAGCALYKQASFADAWFPDDIEIGPDGDVDFFVLPGADSEQPAPIVTAGDVVVQFDGRPAAHSLVAYLASPAGGAPWAAQGGYVSQRTSVDIDSYYQEVDGRFAELLTGDRVTRFDGSDVMPSDIGSDLFWEEITLWIAGSRSAADMAAVLDYAYGELLDG